MRETLRVITACAFVVLALFLSSTEPRQSVSEELTSKLPNELRIDDQLLLGSQVTWNDETGRMVFLCHDFGQAILDFYGVGPTENGTAKAVAIMAAPAVKSGETGLPGETFFDLRQDPAPQRDREW